MTAIIKYVDEFPPLGGLYSYHPFGVMNRTTPEGRRGLDIFAALAGRVTSWNMHVTGSMAGNVTLALIGGYDQWVWNSSIDFTHVVAAISPTTGGPGEKVFVNPRALQLYESGTIFGDGYPYPDDIGTCTGQLNTQRTVGGVVTTTPGTPGVTHYNRSDHEAIDNYLLLQLGNSVDPAGDNYMGLGIGTAFLGEFILTFCTSNRDFYALSNVGFDGLNWFAASTRKLHEEDLQCGILTITIPDWVAGAGNNTLTCPLYSQHAYCVANYPFTPGSVTGTVTQSLNITLTPATCWPYEKAEGGDPIWDNAGNALQNPRMAANTPV